MEGFLLFKLYNKNEMKNEKKEIVKKYFFVVVVIDDDSLLLKVWLIL